MRIAGLCAALLLACSAPREAKPGAADAGMVARPTTPKPAPGPAAPPIVPIGIEPCDRFARAWLACADVLPEADAASAREALDRMLRAWQKTVIDDPAARPAIERTCLSAIDAERKATGARCPGVSWEQGPTAP
jgi:hypothetical protein